MGPRIGDTPTTGPQGTQGPQAGQLQARAGETLVRIAQGWASQLGMPASPESTSAVLREIYRLNPQLAPTAESRIDRATHASVPLTADTTIHLPTTAPEVLPEDRMTRGPSTRETGPNGPNGPQPAAPEDVTTDGPTEEEEPSGFEKVFGPIRKLFKNPMFQGLMAVLNLIPGVNVVVSGICAVIGLTNIISKIAQGDGLDVLKNPLELGSTLGYIAGVFMPGLGAMGGLLGMLQHIKEVGSGEAAEDAAETQQRRDRDQQRTERERTERTTEETTPPSEEIPVEQRVSTAASMLPGVLANEATFAAWLTEVGRLRQHYDRLIAQAEGATPEDKRRAVDQQNPALAGFFNTSLPDAVRSHVSELAFGLDQFQPTEQPTPGQLFRVGQDGQTIAQLAASVNGAPPEMAAALAAYNGTTPDAVLKEGQVVFVPQLPAAGSTWNDPIPTAETVSRQLQQQLVTLREQLAGIQSARAREAMNLLDILERMAARQPSATPRTEGERPNA